MAVAEASPKVSDVLVEDSGVTAPPAKLTLPKLNGASESAKPEEWSSGLSNLASKLAGIKPVEPPPKPAPIVHIRPSRGFD